VCILNRVPCAVVEGGRTPFEGWYGWRPSVHHLRVVGCVVYVKDTKLKLEDRGWKMIFVGYERGSKAYRAYDPLAKCVTVTRDVVFDESAQWSWTGGEDGGELVGDNMFNVQYRVLHEELGDGDLVMEPVTPQTAVRTPDGGYLTPSPGAIRMVAISRHHQAWRLEWRERSQVTMTSTLIMMTHHFSCDG
jgi:hypothetical protein